jgi:hypothetical protein
MITRTLKFVFAGAFAALLFAASPSIGHAQNAPQPTVHMAQNHVIEFGKLPVSMTIARGDTITVTYKFSHNIALFDPAYLPEAVTLDRKAGDVLIQKRALQRLDADTIQVSTFTTARSGLAAIQFKPTFSPTLAIRTIKVIVQ